jgi:hypothetical protein
MISIACVSDLNYITYAQAMFNSFKYKHKQLQYHLLYVGNNKEYTNKTINLSYDNIQLSDKKDIIKDFSTEDNEYKQFFTGNVMLSEKNCYCNNLRFKFVSNLLNTGIKNLIFIDADMLCNRNIDFLKLISYKKDICLQPYFEGKKYYRTNFFYINNTSPTREFFNAVAAGIEKDFGMFKWGHTKYFTELVKQSNLKILDLPENFIDTNYSNNSYIWSGESFRKEKNLVSISTKNFNYINKYESCL